MLENLTAYAIAKLYVTKNLDHFAPFYYTLRHIVLSNTYVVSSVTYGEIRQNFPNTESTGKNKKSVLQIKVGSH